ncbi:aldo/keto reductase [Allorhizocola rhizosphaerae]|uniref:aldo/keto reductase n=1 Tax=Allorhizocola rhizosphaerae TaxID=1872709 RepID=UPI000E3D3A8C|nr:aldo/keto reductase [Allorhizocola rhizosphaerae]
MSRTRPPVSLSRLGLGGSQLGNLYREVSDATAAQTFEAAWEAGIKYFDTAPHYGLGLSERRFGSLLHGLPRDSYILSTKVGRLLEPNPAFAGEQDNEGFAVPARTVRRWDFSREGIRRSIGDSLERLGLDRIDIAFLHDPENHWRQALDEGLPALLELRDEGVVGAIGAGMNIAQHLTELVRGHDVDVVMCAGRYTLLEQADELMSAAAENGVGVVIAGVYNSGLLARPRPDSQARYNYAPAPPDLVSRVHAIADVCERHGVTLPEAALAFPLRHPAVVSVVVGAGTPSQLTDATQRLAGHIPEVVWSELAAAGLISDPQRQRHDR